MTLAPPGPRPDLQSTDVIGDGTTLALRTRTRWQRLRWPLVVTVSFLLAIGLASLLQARTSNTPFAPDNPGDYGSRALAEILKDQGVSVEYVRTTDEAVLRAVEGTTLLVTPQTWSLPLDDLTRLETVPADIVLVEQDGSAISALTDGAVTFDWAAAPGLADAGCADPDALAAERVASASGGGLRANAPDVEVCFTSETGMGTETGTYAVVVQPEHRVAVIADPSLMTNQRLVEDGNAALLLRNLGRHETVVWLVPDPMGAPVSLDLGELIYLGALPPWMPVLLLQLLVVTAAAALWRGRRLGRVVPEPLPVVVRAAEATAGRGRLYRRGRSFGHAAAALRAGAAQRTAGRLGLPRTSEAAAVIDAVAGATGRPIEQVADLLYGPPPTDDAGLVQLARMLDQLESEVHRT